MCPRTLSYLLDKFSIGINCSSQSSTQIIIILKINIYALHFNLSMIGFLSFYGYFIAKSVTGTCIVFRTGIYISV
jgi:hypothetical protein